MNTAAAPPSIDAVHVLLFARYAELLGTERLEFFLPAGATVADVVLRLRARPGGANLPPRLLIARNLEQVDESMPLTAGDELALLPPLSGG
jgi:molybdopterin synthase catalytic subunit